MKLSYPHLKASEKPIATIEEYYAARSQAEASAQKIKEFSGSSRSVLSRLHEQANMLWFSFRHRFPYVLISRCPYCETPVWYKFGGFFSLQDEFWYVEGGNGQAEVYPEMFCPHLFCVDGALNLNGHAPGEAQGSRNLKKRIDIAAEVPFVKPRVLNLPTMVAVVHSVPVAGRYTAYPIVYFAERQPKQKEFCIPWARVEYVDHSREGLVGGTYIGRRSDAQDYELRKWIEQDKLFWVEPHTEESLVRGPASAFPYAQVSGRRHPYYIEKGQVFDLPDPVQGEADIRTESWR